MTIPPMGTAKRIIAGAMSGTSADGVDIALVQVTGRGQAMKAHLLHHHHRPYPRELCHRLFALRGGGGVALDELARCGHDISLCYAAAVNESLLGAHLDAGDVAAIAAHGQTIYHHPPDTVQWLDPALLAAETGCAVVSDFRRADCAAGGQGAPLVPFADFILLRHPTRTRIALNIGGIANLTYLKAGGTIDDVIAFDTGPGNCISDWLCREAHAGHALACRKTKSARKSVPYDLDGQGAAQGRVLQDAVKRFLQHDYFRATPPKSTDGPAMIAAFEAASRGERFELNDLLATAAYLTAFTIHQGAAKFAGPPTQEWLVSGGGVHNKAIMDRLRSLLGEAVIIRSSSDAGVPSQAKEAIAFALLGAATLDGEPSNVPSVTGARRRVVLGSVTPRPVPGA